MERSKAFERPQFDSIFRSESNPAAATEPVDTLVRLDRLSAIHPRASLRIGLSAVIEASDGLSYWALHHPADKPDFHDANGFVLLLEPPGPEW